MYEGLAGYSEQAAGPGNYTPCTGAGHLSRLGVADLTTWHGAGQRLHHAGSEHPRLAVRGLVLPLHDARGRHGPEQLQDRSAAAAADEMAYQGATPGETSPGSSLPVDAERAARPARRARHGAGRPDRSRHGPEACSPITASSTTATLASSPRPAATYHALATAAGKWAAAARHPRRHEPLALRRRRDGNGHRQADRRRPRLDRAAGPRLLIGRHRDPDEIRIGGDSGRSRRPARL